MPGAPLTGAMLLRPAQPSGDITGYTLLAETISIASGGIPFASFLRLLVGLQLAKTGGAAAHFFCRYIDRFHCGLPPADFAAIMNRSHGRVKGVSDSRGTACDDFD